MEVTGAWSICFRVRSIPEKFDLLSSFLINHDYTKYSSSITGTTSSELSIVAV